MITTLGWLRLLLLCTAVGLLASCEDRPQDLGIDAALDSSDDNDAGN